jgi:hypothetical protein
MKIPFFIIAILIMEACGSRNNPQNQEIVFEDSKSFQVEEVIQTNSYTYFKALEDSEERWIAVSKTDAHPGDVYYYQKALEMTDFNSKELNRTFEVIYFVNQINKMPFSSLNPNPPPATMPGHSGRAKAELKPDLSIQKKTTEITIAQIFATPSSFSNKQIEVRGVVVKVNKDIMKRNWIHIQDGTSHNNQFDLTITSQDLPTLNEQVTFKGTIAVDRDFGSGYFYNVIMENAVWVDAKVAGARP